MSSVQWVGHQVGVIFCVLLPQGEWIYAKWKLPTFPDAPVSLLALHLVESPSYVPQNLKSHKEKEHCKLAAALQLSSCSTGKTAVRILVDSMTISFCGLWWSQVLIPVTHQNTAAAVHAGQSQLRKQLLHCLWSVCASRVTGWPLLFLFQVFYLLYLILLLFYFDLFLFYVIYFMDFILFIWFLFYLFIHSQLAACSREKTACSQKCIFPFCEIRPAPEFLISLSQLRNLSYSQFTLAGN